MSYDQYGRYQQDYDRRPRGYDQQAQQGQRYQPYQGDYRQAAPPPAPPKKGSKGKYVLVGVGVLLLLATCGAVVGGSGGTNTPNGVTAQTAAAAAGGQPAGQAPAAPAAVEHAEDVQITNCASDAVGWAEADVVVTNHSSKTSNYIINIVFESADGAQQVGTGLVAVNNLNPGQRSEQTANALKNGIPGMVCKVSDITRYAS